MIDRFANRNIEGLPTLHIAHNNQGNTTPSTPTFANSGQQNKEAMMSRGIGALGRGAISQSAASVVAASSTGLKRLFEQAKEGAVKKEGKFVLVWNSLTVVSSRLLLICKLHSCISVRQHAFGACLCTDLDTPGMMQDRIYRSGSQALEGDRKFVDK